MAGPTTEQVSVPTRATDDGETRRIDDLGIRVSSSEARERRGGEALGRYVLLRPLGRGGMSVVWLAYDPELDRRVALKLLHAGGRGGVQGSGADRLLREAQALARLSHPNVVHIYDVGVLPGGDVYLAMELIAGDTLREWSERRSRSEAEILDVLARAGRGLAAAHAVGLVHLDVKPSNVLVGDDGEVRVVDFGLARAPRRPSLGRGSDPGRSHASHRLDEQLTEAGAVLGTPGYIAPEILSGADADARADQFSFCVMAWELLTGERPFVGDDRATLHRNVVEGVLHEGPGAARLRPRVRRALRRGLATRVEERHADIDGLLAALRPAHRRGSPVLGAITAAALALAWFVGREPAEAGDPCARIDDGIAGVWNDERGRAVAAAFAATRLPYADDAARTVIGRLDERARQWRTAMTEGCAAAIVRGEQPLVDWELRRACLEDGRAQMAALVDVFAGADARVVEHAVGAAGGLPPIEHCADVEALRVQASAPDSPEGRAALASTRRRIMQAQVLLDAGRFADADELATVALADARAVGHPATLARAAQTAASAASSLGQHGRAEPLLEESLWAAERGALDRLRLELLVDLTYTAGHLRRDAALGQFYADVAEGVADRLEISSPMRARLLSHRGVLASDAGRFEQALRLFEAALTTEQHTADHEQLAALLVNLGSAHYERGDHREALGYYERAYDQEVGPLGPAHPRMAELLENRANAEQALGELDAALAHHLEALHILERAGVDGGSSFALQLNNIGVVLTGMRRHDEAAHYYERARALLMPEQDGHPLVAVVLANLGETRLGQGRPEDALPLYRDAEERLRRTLGEDHPYRAMALAGIGAALLESGDPHAARDPLERAVAMYQASPGDPVLAAEARFALARVLVMIDGTTMRPRIRELAGSARDGLRGGGARSATTLASVESFLARLDRAGVDP